MRIRHIRPRSKFPRFESLEGRLLLTGTAMVVSGPFAVDANHPDWIAGDALPPTAADLQWMYDNMIVTQNVSLNQLALQRIGGQSGAVSGASVAAAMAQAGQLITGMTQAQLDALSGSGAVSGLSSQVLALALPSAVDNSLLPAFPPIGNQGAQGSCASWASTYYLATYMTGMLRPDFPGHGTDSEFSPKWTYDMVNGGQDLGSTIPDNYEMLMTHGAATWTQFPYDETDFRLWVYQAADVSIWRDALGYKMDKTGVISYLDTNTGLKALKTLLADGFILNFTTDIYGWQSKPIGDDPSTPGVDPHTGEDVTYWVQAIPSGHAMTVVGYDDSIWADINGNGVADAGELGALKIANSWGDTWENGGFVWLSYDALKAMSDVPGAPQTNRRPAWDGASAYWMTAKASYTPKLLAQFTINSAMRDQIFMSLGLGAITGPTPTQTWTPFALQGNGGPLGFDGVDYSDPNVNPGPAPDGTFVLDFSDLAPQIGVMTRYFLGLNDHADAAHVGTIIDFQLTDTAGNPLAVCPFTAPPAVAPPGGVPQTDADDPATTAYAWVDSLAGGNPVSGTVFQDLNGNSVLDAGEPGQGNWAVMIFNDANGNGLPDTTEFSAITMTAPDGTYSFTDLPTGDYTVALTVQGGWQQTGPIGTVYSGHLADGQVVDGLDFGVVHPASIAGAVWGDLNGNGTQNAGDIGIQGIGVFLDTNGNGQLDVNETSTLTDANGAYSFSNVIPGQYSVIEVLPVGWTQTAVAVAQPMTVSDGDNLTGVSFGLAGPNLADGGSLLGGLPAVLHPGQSASLSWLVNNPGPVASGAFHLAFYASKDTTITAADTLLGEAAVASIAGGGSQIVNYTATVPAAILAGNWHIGVIIDSRNEVVESNETDNVGADGSYTFKLPGIYGQLWEDQNNNGVIDAGEAFLGGRTMFLDTNQNGHLDAGEVSTTTNAQGEYAFTGLTPGVYYVDVVLPPIGWSQVYPVTANQAVNYAADDLKGPYNFGVRGTADLKSDGPQFSSFLPLTVVSPGSKFDIWWDIRNVGSAVAGQFRVDFYASTDTTIDSTDYSLGYQMVSGLGVNQYVDINLSLLAFPTIPAGNYYIGVVIDSANSVLESRIVNSVDVGETNNTDVASKLLKVTNVPDLHASVPLYSGFQPDVMQPTDQWDSWFEIANSGSGPAGRFRVDFYASTNNTISTQDYHLGYAWVSGVGQGQHVMAALSSFNFPAIPPGTYYVGIIIDRSNSLVEMDKTNNTAVSDQYPLTVPGLSGAVWNDINGDGIRNLGEPGLADWRVFIDLNGNGVWNPGEPDTLTKADGSYWFNFVPAATDPSGSIWVAQQVQVGWAQTCPTPTVSYELPYVPGTIVQNLDFGDVQTAEIRGAKWHDRNGDGQINNGEEGLASWVIYVDANDNGQRDPGEDYALTDDAGNYVLTGLLPGTYVIREDSQYGWGQSAPGGDGSYTVTVQSGDVIRGKDFGNYQSGTTVTIITGLKWLDYNGNGVRELYEPALAGWTIYADLNNNGVLDSGEPSAVTEAGEQGYSLGNLRPGTYRIREVMQTGWAQSFPVGGSYLVTIQSGDVITGINFGNYQPGVIRGLKWLDLDADGEFKLDGEPGLQGWNITLNGPGGPWTVLTDANGQYQFNDLVPGQYTVSEENRAGWVRSYPINATYQVSISSGSDVEDVNFGNYQPPTISGTKWQDMNGDGVKDPGDTGLAGWTIFLDQNQNGVLDQGETSAVTDGNGNFTFAGLIPAPYYVAEVLQSNWVQTFPAGGVEQEVIVQSGDNKQVSLGNFKPGEIHGSEWNDLNGNGTWDAGEPGLTSWTVNAFNDLNGNGVLDGNEQLLTTTTDVNGHYAFTGLLAGSYVVSEVLSANWVQTAPGGSGKYSVVIASSVVALNKDFGNYQFGQIHGTKWLANTATGLGGWTIYLDYDLNGRLDANEPSAITASDGTYAFTALPLGTYTVAEVMQPGWIGMAPPGGTYSVTITSGLTVNGLDFRNEQVAEIHGAVWHDLDANGVREAGEPGLAGWTVSAFLDLNANGLMDGTESTVTATTDANGDYSFVDLMPGSYVIYEDVQPTWNQSAPAGGTYQVTIPSGGSATGKDFGDYKLGHITGLKWYDLNADGVLDPGEPALAGWTIFIDANGNGKLDAGEANTVTAADGSYSFDVIPGAYKVAEVQQNGWDQSAPQGGTSTATVLSDRTVSSVNFGNYRPGEIHGIKWNDLNANGVIDAGESGLQGWTIYLDLNRNGQYDAGTDLAAVTDANGNYAFLDLRPRQTYLVAEVLQPGWLQTFPASPGTYSIDVNENNLIHNNVNLGNAIPVEIHGNAWHDLNTDRAKDAGEPGLANWTVFLDLNNDGILQAGEPSTLTDDNGDYAFTGLLPGTYHVRETMQTGWASTWPTTSNQTVPLLSGQSASNINFGNEQVPVVNDLASTTDEDTPISATLTGTDFEGNAMVFSSVAGPGHGLLTLNPNGTFTYTPDLNWNGTDQFTFNANDGFGDSAPGTVTITVNPVNDKPVANNQSVSVLEDGSVDITLGATDVETTSSQLIYDITTPPSHGTIEFLAPNLVRYHPDANYNGPDSLVFTVTDDGDPVGSDANPSDLTSDPATVGITVTPVNDRPTASDVSATVAQDESVQVILLGNDVETPQNQLVYAIATAPSHGSVTLAGNVATYTPAPGWFGEDSFTYTVRDNGDPAGGHANPGDLTSTPAAASITVVLAFHLNAGQSKSFQIGGRTITVKLGGPVGTAVVLPTYYFYGQPDIRQIVVNGTDQRSSLTITAPYGATVGDIAIHGSLGSLAAKTSDLVGDITVDNTIGSLVMEDVVSAPADHTIKIGAPTPSISRVNMTFARVAELSIDSSTPINSLTAAEWIDADATPDVVKAPFLTTLTVKSVKGQGTGDFQAGLDLSGNPNTTQPTLGTVTIAGGLSDAVWDVDGQANNISVTGAVDGWTLDVLPPALTSVKQIVLGVTGAASVNVNGTIGTLKAAQWTSGVIHADSVSSLSIVGNSRDKTVGGFGADLTLDGPVNPKQAALGTTSITGAIGGSWNITGNVSSITGSSTAPGWDAKVSGDILNLLTTGDAGGQIKARTLKSMTVKGNLTGAQIELTQGLVTSNSTALTLGSLYVTGKMQDSTIRSAGNIGTASVGAMLNGNLLAGVKAGVTALPGGRTDFDPVADSLLPTISTVTIRGQAGAATSYENSNISAWKLGTISIEDVLTDTPGSTAHFGLAGNNMRSYVRRQGTAIVTKWTGGVIWPSDSLDDYAVVRVV